MSLKIKEMNVKDIKNIVFALCRFTEILIITAMMKHRKFEIIHALSHNFFRTSLFIL